jgi:hypothetical protein
LFAPAQLALNQSQKKQGLGIIRLFGKDLPVCDFGFAQAARAVVRNPGRELWRWRRFLHRFGHVAII